MYDVIMRLRGRSSASFSLLHSSSSRLANSVLCRMHHSLTSTNDDHCIAACTIHYILQIVFIIYIFEQKMTTTTEKRKREEASPDDETASASAACCCCSSSCRCCCRGPPPGEEEEDRRRREDRCCREDLVDLDEDMHALKRARESWLKTTTVATVAATCVGGDDCRVATTTTATASPTRGGDGDGDAVRKEETAIESTYRRLWTKYRFRGTATATSPKDDGDVGKRRSCCCGRRTRRREQKEEEEIRKTSGEKLALLLLQRSSTSGKSTCRERSSCCTASAAAAAQQQPPPQEEADRILSELGYTCRLATNVFDYDSDNGDGSRRRPLPLPPPPPVQHSSSSSPYCRAYDDFLESSSEELQRFGEVFLNPDAPYWTDHAYSVEPPSPYFSYVVPLSNSSSNYDNNDNNNRSPNEDPLVAEYGALGSVIRKLQRRIAEWKPSLASSGACNYVELWAHNRPGVTGHQLHFDSDNEGCDGVIRHPVVTAVLYLTGGGDGGPTLVTNQRLASRRAADRGWLAHPAANRLVLMDGRVLHCVVPGKLPTTQRCDDSQSSARDDSSARCKNENRRVTVMFAFWKRIRVRDEGTIGAARPFPGGSNGSGSESNVVDKANSPSKPVPSWASRLRAPLVESSSAAASGGKPAAAVAVEPVALSHVYERVVAAGEAGTAEADSSNGSSDTASRPWSSRRDGFPEYDRVFQGI